MTAALEGGEWSAVRPGKTRYSYYRRLGEPQGWSGRAKNLVPTGIRSRTVQAVAQSLFRLSYPTHIFPMQDLKNIMVYILITVRWQLLCSLVLGTLQIAQSDY